MSNNFFNENGISNFNLDYNLTDLNNNYIEFLFKKKGDFEYLLHLLNNSIVNKEILTYIHLKEEILEFILIIGKKIELLNPPILYRCTGMTDYMYFEYMNRSIKEIKNFLKDNSKLDWNELISEIDDYIIFSNKLNQFEENNNLTKFYPK
jgi:hypothetical protein